MKIENILSPKTIVSYSKSRPKAKEHSAAYVNLNNSYLSILNKSLISFSSMKRRRFSGVDLVIVNKFNAPIEKFNSLDDFQKWCGLIVEKNYLSNTDELLKGHSEETKDKKEKILEEWIKHLTSKEKYYSPSKKLLILSSLTKKLKQDKSSFPPFFDEDILEKTITEIEKKSNLNRNYVCDFDELYRRNFVETILKEDSNAQGGLTGWFIIPSKTKDSKNFGKNVRKLQILSSKMWCTKTLTAKEYLEKGDFHIYLKNGKPKLGVRFENDRIVEIQGKLNDGRIPISFFDILKEHIEGCNFSKNAKNQIKKCETVAENTALIKEKYGKNVFKNKEYSKILSGIGILNHEDENGKLVLWDYDSRILADYNIDQQDLLNKIKEIKHDLYLGYTGVKNLGSIKSIGGNLEIIECHNLSSLGNLEYVGEDLSIENCKSLSNLGNLKRVEDNCKIKNCKKLASLGALAIVGGDMEIDEPNLASLGELEFVGGRYSLNASESLKNSGKLKYIGDSF